MSDERTDQTPAREQAPVSRPPRRWQATGEVPPISRLGRLVNRLDANHWYLNVPMDARVNVFDFLCPHGVWLEPETLRGVFGPPLCDGGNPELCSVGCEAENAAFDFLESLPRPLHDVATTLFAPGDIMSLATNVREDYFMNQGDRTSIYARVLSIVSEMEHRLHTYGIRMSPREGKAAARMHLMRYVLLLTIAFEVPVVDASESAYRFGEDPWAELKQRINRRLDLARIDFLDMRSRAMWRVQTQTECVTAIRPATHSEVAAACRNHEFNGVECELYRETFFSRSSAEPPVLFMAPRLVCGLVTRSSLARRAAVDLTLSVVSIVAILMAVKSARLFFSAFRVLAYLLVISIRVIHRSCSRCATSATRHFSLSRDKALVKEAPVVAEQVLESAKDGLYRLVSTGLNSLDSLEMSVRGSEIKTSTVVPGCVYLAVVYDGDVTFVGMGFRHDKYLITAQHNIFAMTSCPGNYYLIPFRPDKNAKICSLDMDRMLELTPDMLDQDIVTEEFVDYDAAIIPIASSSWSKLGVKTLEKADAVWNANITVYGLEKSGLHKLQRSLGGIVRNDKDPMQHVYYNASTLKGWSGSPVLSGHKKVVAVHCGTTGEVNRGLNFAFVRMIIDIHEHRTLEHSSDAEEDEIVHSCRGKHGRLSYRQEELELEKLEDAAHARRRVVAHQGKNGTVWFQTPLESERDEPLEHIVTNFKEVRYYGESAFAPPPVETQKQPVPPAVEEVELPKPSSPRSEGLFSYAVGAPFEVGQCDIRLSAPYFRGPPADPEKMLDMQRAVELGYEPAAYAMPKATDRASAISRSKSSLSKSLAEVVDVRTNAAIPSDDLRLAAKTILLDMMRPLRYVVDGEGVTKAKIVSQLNSSAVGCSKSPGLPYVLEAGVTKNSDLLTKYGVEELADRAVQKYRDDTWLQNSINMMKIEPMKKEKIEAGLDRCVQSVSLDTQLYFRCHFGGIADAAAKNYRKNPIMCGWSPLKPGDGEHLYESLRKKDKKILEYDGQAFEFIAHTEEAYADVTDIFIGLAQAGPKVTDQQMKDWRAEARSFTEKVGKSGYVVADGTTVTKNVAFVLSSGRWDTYLRNSITGLYWFVIGLLESGYTGEDIVKQFVLKVGGDDSVAAVPKDFKTSVFADALRAYGMKIHKVRLVDIEEGFEFFSWRFTKDSRGSVQWVPTRFTKHMMNLIHSKHENRPQSLLSHMMNWAHSPNHFEFFRSSYVTGHMHDPELYDLAVLPDRSALLLHYKGLESMIPDPKALEALLFKAKF